MAERIISMRLALAGEKEVLARLEAVNASLAQSGEALASINEKSRALETLTKRLKAMSAELESVSRRLAATQSGGVPGVPEGVPQPSAAGLATRQTKLTEEINKTKTAAQSLRQELEGIEKGSDTYREIIARVAKTRVEQAALNAEVRVAQREFERTKVAFGSYRDLELQLQRLREQFRQLNGAEREGAKGKDLINKVVELDAKLKQVDASLGIYTRNVGNYASAFDGFSSIATRIGTAFGITAGLNEFIQANSKASDEVANVAKTANISIEAVRKFQEQLKQRDTRTSLVDQLKISEIGGQLGVAEAQLLSFTDAVDKTNVALGDEFNNNVEEVTRVTGGLRNVFKELQGDDIGTDILKISNALNVLSADGNATSPVIAEFANRIGGVAVPLGASAKSIFGLSTVLNELNVTAERGGTGVVRILTEIGKTPEKFAQIAGVGAAEFRQLVETDIVGALALVSKKTAESSESNIELIQTLEELKLNGQGELEVFNKLGQSYDLYTKRVGQAGEALQSTASIQEEFNKKNATFGAEIDKLKNALINLTVNTDFQDFLSSGISGITSFVNVLAGLPKVVSENKTELVALALAVLAFNTQSIAASVNAIRQSSAYLLLTSAAQRQAAAQGIMNSVMRAFPLLAIIAVVYSAVKAYQALVRISDGAAQGAKAFAAAQKEISESVGKETAALNRNFAVLKNAAATTSERTAAIKALQEAYPEYLRGLDLEKLSVSELNDLQKSLTASILQSVAARKKAQVQEEFATQIIEKTLRIQAIQQAGTSKAATFGEVLKFAGGTGTDTKLAAQKIIEGLTAEVKQLEIASDEASKAFDGLIKPRTTGTENIAASAGEELQQDAAEKRAEQRKAEAAAVTNLRKLTNAQLEALDTEAAKAELSRRKTQSDRLKELAEQRAKDEKAAAENIYKLQQDLIKKTYEGRIELAQNQTATAISALVGTPQQIETQRALLGEQLRRTIADIEAERDKARQKALADIAAFRADADQQTAQRQETNTTQQIEVVRRLTEIDKVTSGADYRRVQAELDQALAAQLVTREEYQQKTAALALQQEARMLEIERQGYVAEKTFIQQQQQDRLNTLQLGYDAELVKLREAEAARFAELQALKDSGEISETDFFAAENDLRAAQFQSRLDAERAFRTEQAAIVQETALGILQTEAELAEQARQLDADTNEQKVANALATREQLAAVTDASFNLLGEYVTGAAKLLGQDAENRKKYGGVLKALAVAEIAINLRKELSAISLAAIQAGAATGPFGFLVAGGIYSLQAAAAIVKAGFNTAAVLSQKFEFGGVLSNQSSDSVPVEGGSIPKGSGVIQGRRHSKGGVKAVYNGRLVEFEGGEYQLRNGKETYIINRKATVKHADALLRMSDSPNKFSALRKALASSINTSTGGKKFATGTTPSPVGGRVFADGGIAPSPLDIRPLEAPSVSTAQTFTIGGNLASREEVQAILSLARGAVDLAAAANNRVDNIQVINNPLDTLDIGAEQQELRSVRNL